MKQDFFVCEIGKTKIENLSNVPNGYLLDWNEANGMTLFVLFKQNEKVRKMYTSEMIAVKSDIQ